MTTNAKPRNSSKVLNVSEQDIDDIMTEIRNQVTVQRSQGEFTTDEYARKYKMSSHRAYNELIRAQAMGIITVRQPGGVKTLRYWKRV